MSAPSRTRSTPASPKRSTSSSSRGARLFVATSKNQRDARRIVEHFGLASKFEEIHGARRRRRPRRQDRADRLRAGDATPWRGRDRIAMIGDRKFDAIGARNVGVAAIGALWGYGPREELEAAGADPIVATPREIPAAVSAIWSPARL